MELINYNKETKEFTLKMDQNEFWNIVDLVSGVAATSSLQDFTALGSSEERVFELASLLGDILKKHVEENYNYK